MTIALVTDSNAQLPRSLIDRYGIRVAPLGITLNGEPFREGIDLTNDEFYRRLNAGESVQTNAPSPGDVLGLYEAAARDGCDRAVSIHIGSNTSATLNAVHIAAGMSPIPVEIVDTGTASFAVGCCVWGAAEAIAAGASVPEARDRALEIAASIGNVFIVGALGLAEAGGRLAPEARDAPAPVLALEDGKMRAVAQVTDAQSAREAMVSYVMERSRGIPQRIGVGNAGVELLTQRFASQLEATGVATEIVRYDIGPSVGAHTGFGTYGCVFFPAER